MPNSVRRELCRRGAKSASGSCTTWVNRWVPSRKSVAPFVRYQQHSVTLGDRPQKKRNLGMVSGDVRIAATSR